MPKSYNPNEVIQVHLQLAGESIAYPRMLENIKKLGEGGMAKVFEVRRIGAQQDEPNVIAAMKVYDPSTFSADELARFHREINFMAGLSHPNIAAFVGSGQTQEGDYFYLAERIEGDTLRKILSDRANDLGLNVKCTKKRDLEDTHSSAKDSEKEYRTMSFAEFRALKKKMQKPAIAFGYVKMIMCSILDVLEYLHRQNIVHRDLKPENIIIVFSPEETMATVKVLDFGISKRIVRYSGPETCHTKTGTIMGSPEYMAPEQALTPSVDARTDVYAAGLIMQAMLTGLRFINTDEGNFLSHMSVRINPAEVHDPAEYIQQLPEAIRRVVLKATQFKPEDRYQSAIEMRDALEGAFEGRLSSPSLWKTMQRFVVNKDTSPIAYLPTEKHHRPSLVQTIAEGTIKTGKGIGWMILFVIAAASLIGAAYFLINVRSGKIDPAAIQLSVSQRAQALTTALMERADGILLAPAPSAAPSPASSVNSSTLPPVSSLKMNGTQRSSFEMGKTLLRSGKSAKALEIFLSLKEDGVQDPELLQAIASLAKKKSSTKKTARNERK